MEPRAFTRVLVHIDAQLETASGEEFEGVVRDLSLKGISIEGDGTATAGEECAITILLVTGTEPIPIRLTGSVVRHDAGVVAATFSTIAAGDLEHLEKLVHYNAPDPGALEDELVSYRGTRPLIETS